MARFLKKSLPADEKTNVNEILPADGHLSYRRKGDVIVSPL